DFIRQLSDPPGDLRLPDEDAPQLAPPARRWTRAARHLFAPGHFVHFVAGLFAVGLADLRFDCPHAAGRDCPLRAKQNQLVIRRSELAFAPARLDFNQMLPPERTES